ncbi:helix-turn-helix domain-containing protein [Streptomyces mirabilis]|uniref:helix-turn-helix domain-containing protein n=1 Tax=Streptomyces mirabilis TaxID=68239 RepID=UPI0036C9200F
MGSGLSVVGVGVRITQVGYVFRLDPGSGQRVALARAFGCARATRTPTWRGCRMPMVCRLWGSIWA